MGLELVALLFSLTSAGNTQMTVNNQIFVGTLMNLSDNPTRVSIRQDWRESDITNRVPIIVTGNDFSTIYAPLISDGRMEKFYWYDQGAYLFLPSYVMRTHGAKQQRESVKRTPMNQLEPVFEMRLTSPSPVYRGIFAMFLAGSR
ncbi:hypothetical protein ES332_A01G173500v1 [Gossypium tomentosum]|uniref:DNA-directed RNA polymerase N-terminal domain-containing protein n=1 Tax=Gossypium tomentosum TaxID=34277 RepID=A0A5D2RSZ8_GOSTO|nr:hypothetical protein ES332_A01G173500v1 [Gossypium tomentosum]